MYEVRRGVEQERLQRERLAQFRNDLTSPKTSTPPRQQTVVRSQPGFEPVGTVIIFKSELDYLSRCILDYPDIETGGQLFGYWSNTGLPVVAYVLGPGPRANHQTTFFNQDIAYLKSVGQKLIDNFGLQQIGEWHSHHRLGLARPSGHDASTMVNNIRNSHLGRHLLCIGNCDDSSSTINAFSFTEAAGYAYRQAQWLVKDMDSPFRTPVDSGLESFLVHPRCRQASHGRMNLVVDADTLSTPRYDKQYWLTLQGNNAVLKRIIETVTHIEGRPAKVTAKLDDDNRVHLVVDRGWRQEQIYFPQGFPDVQPVVLVFTDAGDQEGTPAEAPWQFDGDIYRSFINFYKQLF